MLDNIRSGWNVGSIFRTADAIGVRKLYLCGITPTPNDQKLKKSALGAGDWIPWEQYPNAVLLAEKLQTKGCCLCAIEQDKRAVDITKSQDLPCLNWQNGLTEPPTVIMILGNEVTGVDPGLLAISESVISIGMRGKKRSLNVAVAFGIAAYQLSLLTKQ
jgi:23S rRNA (guanosine2251-2'-O)-methyltransferase